MPHEATDRCYREILQTDPDNADVKNGFELALFEQGDLAGAESEFASVLQADPGNARTVDGLGYVLILRHRFDEAKSRFLESMQLDPKYALVHLHYAICLHAQQQTREAVSDDQKALALDNQLSSACNHLAWMLATDSDPEIRNVPEAVELAERACRLIDSEQPIYLTTLVAAYAGAGRFKDAVNTAEKARGMARLSGLEKTVEQNEKLLELFRTGRTYNERSAPID